MKLIFYFTLFSTLVFSTSSYSSDCSEAFAITELLETTESLKTKEEIESLTNKEVQELTVKEIKKLGYKIKYLKTKQIILIKGKQKINALPFGSMTAEQTKALTIDQIRYISTDPLDPLLNPFFPIALMDFSTKQIPMFKPEQVSNLLLLMKIEQVQALTKKQVQAIHPEILDIVMDFFTLEQKNYFTLEQRRALEVLARMKAYKKN